MIVARTRFSIDNGMLTSQFKPRRKQIQARLPGKSREEAQVPMASDQAVAATPDDAARPHAGGVFANHDFTKLWLGETVSQIGTQVTQFAMPLVAILTLKATVFEVGVLNALRFVPGHRRGAVRRSLAGPAPAAPGADRLRAAATRC